mgnify:CR=1 FL=1
MDVGFNSLRWPACAREMAELFDQSAALSLLVLKAIPKIAFAASRREQDAVPGEYPVADYRSVLFPDRGCELRSSRKGLPDNSAKSHRCQNAFALSSTQSRMTVTKAKVCSARWKSRNAEASSRSLSSWLGNPCPRPASPRSHGLRSPWHITSQFRRWVPEIDLNSGLDVADHYADLLTMQNLGEADGLVGGRSDIDEEFSILVIRLRRPSRVSGLVSFWRRGF